MMMLGLDKFYGRKDILPLLKRRVLDLKEGYRQNVAFLGDRYIGKSTILLKFLSDLDEPDIFAVYLDLENKDIDYLYRQYVAQLLYPFARLKNLPLHEDIPLLMESLQTQLPQTVRSVKRIQSFLLHEKRAEAYKETIGLPQVFAREAEKFCVLIFDEFQHLEDWDIPQVYQELGSKIMTQKRCLYVASSSAPVQARKILSEKLSLLFGNFETILVEPFDLATSDDFIRFQLQPVKMGDLLRHFLVDFTGGHPLYLHLICQEMAGLCQIHQQTEVFLPLLTQAVENVVFHPWGVLSRHYDLMISSLSTGKGQYSSAKILVALAEGKMRLKEMVSRVQVKQGLVTQKLNKLMEGGLVSKNGSFFYLRDKLLRYWIKYVFQRRMTAWDVDCHRQRVSFQEEIAQTFNHFKNNAQKRLPERIMELLRCFEEEAYLINGRRYKLPLFREIGLAETQPAAEGCVQLLKGSADEGEWFIALKEETICENDINWVLTQARKGGQRPLRCILISFAQLDENVRVRALQERMWIWNEGELNALLNLYDKPYIVREAAGLEGVGPSCA